MKTMILIKKIKMKSREVDACILEQELSNIWARWIELSNQCSFKLGGALVLWLFTSSE